MGEAGLSAAEVGKEISEHRHHTGGEAEGHDRVITIIEAILLAIVALLAAWSGFASSKWSTESRIDLAEASTARTEANRAAREAEERQELRRVHVQRLVRGVRVRRRAGRRARRASVPARVPGRVRRVAGDEPLDEPRRATRPELHARVQAARSQEAAKLDKRADEKFAAGQEAAENADDYVRTTVYLATVLFLVGISGHFRVRTARASVSSSSAWSSSASPVVTLATLPGLP